MVVDRLKNFHAIDTFKKEALHLLMRTINQDEEEVAKLRKVFDKININGTGMINASELCKYMQEQNYSVTPEEAQVIMTCLDYHGSG